MARNKRPRPLNKVSPDDNFSVGEIERLIANLDKEPAALREVRFRLETAQTAIASVNALQANEPNFFQVAGREAIEKDFLYNKRVEENLLPRIALHDDARRVRVSTQATNSINRKYSDSSINSYVMRHRNSGMNQSAGMAEASNNSWLELQERQKDLHGRMGTLRSNMTDIAENLYDDNGQRNPEALKQLRKYQARFTGLADELVKVNVGLDHSKREGKDPDSRFAALTKVKHNAYDVLKTDELERQMKEGKGLGAFSAKDLKQKELDASSKLLQAMEDLKESFGKGAKVVDQFTERAEKAAAELEAIQDAQALGGKKQDDKWKSAAIVTSAVGQFFSIAGNAVQTMGVEQPMRQMANVAGYANLENQKYDMWTSAAEGNMTARMNLSGWSNATAFGRSMAHRTGIALGLRGGGSLLATAGGVLQGIDAVASLPGGTTVGKVLGNAQTVQNLALAGTAIAENGVNTAVIAKDALQHISTSEAEIAANNASMAASKQLNHISGYQLQQYRDYAMGLQQAARSVGRGKADAFLDKAGGDDFMDRMANVGLGMDQMAKLSDFGAQNMGSVFDADQVVAAKHYENQNYGLAQENMRRMAGFAMAGSQNPMQSLERVLERTAGYSSKALSVIADNTGQLVEQAYTQGSQADLSGTIAAIIAGSVDKKNGNDAFAVKQAADTFKSEEQWKTNTSASFAGMMAVSGMMVDTKLSFEDSLLMTKISTPMLTNWSNRAKKGESTATLAEELAGQGIDVSQNDIFTKNPNDFFAAAANRRVINQIVRGGAGLAFQSTQGFAAYRDWANDSTIDEVTRAKRRALLTDTSGLNDPSIPAEMRKEIINFNRSVRTQDGNPQAVGRDIAQQLGWLTAGEVKIAEENERRGGVFNINQAEAAAGDVKRIGAAKQVGKFSGGKTGSAHMGWVRQTGVDVQNAATEDEFSDAAARSAADFGKSAKVLNTAGNKLIMAADKLIELAGMNKKDNEAGDAAEDAEIKRVVDASFGPTNALTNKLNNQSVAPPGWNPQGKQNKKVGKK